jgi:hypothetical protein
MKVYLQLFLLLALHPSALLPKKNIVKKEKYFMVLGSPSSGSTFLFYSIKKSLPKYKAQNEFFNRLFNMKLLNLFQIATEKDSSKAKTNSLLHSKYITAELPHTYINYIYEEKWLKSKNIITKEVLINFFIDFFIEKFTTIAIYRHRKHTFPTKERKELIFLYLFDNFMNTNYTQNDTLVSVQLFLEKFSLSDKEKKCAAHIIYNYLLLKACQDFKIPLITYENIINLKKEDLEIYLKEKIPADFFKEKLAEIIDKDKIKEEDFLQSRSEMYNSLETEPFCQELIEYLKTIDPAMQYWYLLE